ncbi:MAG: DUF481 domain-containing protein [Spongiibacteraceae bacterium]|jgi:putative salt-induced outer membrane protein YdiY|nr:DUF481 domain-containing protein [Spongiibacteraceae bacterium]
MRVIDVTRRIPLALGLCAAAGWTQADTLWLTNGDTLEGTFKQVAAGKLVWQSTAFGEISVDQSAVAFVQSDGRYNVSVDGRSLSDCQLQREGDQQLLVCAEGSAPLTSWAALAEVKVPPSTEKKLVNKGDLTVAITDSSGNTNEESYAVDVRDEARYGNTRHRFVWEYDYKTADDVRSENRTTGIYKYDLFFTEKWYFNANLGYERDEFADLDARYVVGSGVGYQVYDTETLKLSLENGINYVWQYFGEDEDREYAAYRWDLDLAWVITEQGLRFFHRHNIRYSLEDSADWEFESDTGFRMPVLGRLSAEVKYEYDYDHLPAETASRVDRKWSVGVVYDW